MISIVIPACNEENYIKDTLESVKMQDFKEYEVIVVCNGCTDKTENIAKKYTKKVFNLKEGNVLKAKNFGAKKSKGDIIIFLDADTIFYKENALNNIIKSNIKLGTCKFIPDKKELRFKMFAVLKNLFTYVMGGANGILICTKEIFNIAKGFDIDVFPRENYFFLKKAKKYSKFILLKDYVITSMRRHKEIGYLSLTKYWLDVTFSKERKKYEVIR